MKKMKNEVMVRQDVVILTDSESENWKNYRNVQIQSLVADALSRSMNDDIIKRLVSLAIARQIDQMHNSADRKISAYENKTPLSLDELFSVAGRSTAKAIAYEQAMELFLEAALADKDAAKTVLRDAKKADTSAAWERAVVELKRIIG